MHVDWISVAVSAAQTLARPCAESPSTVLCKRLNQVDKPFNWYLMKGLLPLCPFGAVEKTDELVLRGSLDKAGLLGRSQTWKRNK